MKLATKVLVSLLAVSSLGCSILGGSAVDPTPTGARPVGWLYSTLYSRNAVLEVNVLQSRAEQSPIMVPNGPRAVAIDPRGRGEQLYVVCELGNTVAVVDRRTRQITRSIDVGSQPYGIAIAANQTAARAFVTNAGSDTVSVIDLKTNTVVNTVSLKPTQAAQPGTTAPTAMKPQGVAVNADGTRAYVACAGGQVVVLEAARLDGTFSATRTIPLSGSVAPQNIAVANLDANTEMAYVTDPSGNRVFFFNGKQQSNVAEVRELNGAPWGVAVGVNPTTLRPDRVFITTKQRPALWALKPQDLQAATSSSASGVSVEGRDPTYVTVSPIGDQVFVSLSGDNTITVFRRVGEELARPEQFNIQQLRSDFIAPTGDLALGGFLFQ